MTGVKHHVNLLPYNAIDFVPYSTPSSSAIRLFAETLRAHGVETTVRETRGLDADAACGQLAAKRD